VIDQADKLRALVQTVAPSSDAQGSGVPMVVVTGGRAGVGATTVALNLAAVLADGGARVLLVDGAQQRNEFVEPAGIRPNVQYTWADVLAGKCELEEAVVDGPVGVRLLLTRGRVSQFDSAHCRPRRESGSRRDAATWGDSRRAQERLIGELRSLEEDYDLIVVDSGCGPTAWSRRFWAGAKLIVLVTTPEDAAVLNAYATLKYCAQAAGRLPVRLLVNQAESDAAANAAHRRLESACQRFLSRSIPALPALPRHGGEFMRAQPAPRVWEIPNTPFGHAVLWLGRVVSELMAKGLGGPCATACSAPSDVEYSGSTARG
jgi:flagellar biosynthesis protein FlhG